jgi:WD40 repeat protein
VRGDAGRTARVSASQDQTLKVWDLESRRALATLEGHAWRVTLRLTSDEDHDASDAPAQAVRAAPPSPDDESTR